MDHESALDKALKLAGGRAKLAASLGIAPQAISQWRDIPVRRVLDIEALTGIPRSTLRPDIYPPSREGAAA
jgi:DNA-binding transcriptional regulator YdaS (Cro superfamily)